MGVYWVGWVFWVFLDEFFSVLWVGGLCFGFSGYLILSWVGFV